MFITQEALVSIRLNSQLEPSASAASKQNNDTRIKALQILSSWIIRVHLTKANEFIQENISSLTPVPLNNITSGEMLSKNRSYRRNGLSTSGKKSKESKQEVLPIHFSALSYDFHGQVISFCTSSLPVSFASCCSSISIRESLTFGSN